MALMNSGADQRRIWEHFQNARVDSFSESKTRLNFLLRIIGNLHPLHPKILNIGVGNGHLERYASSAYQWKVEAVDPDEQAVARLASEGINAQVGTIENLSQANCSMDFVVVSEVLEHLTNEQFSSGLAEILRVLRPGGWMIGTVPHAERLSDQEAVCPKCGEVFHRWGHQRSFTIEEMRSSLSKRFTVEVIKRTAFVPLFGRGLRGFFKAVLRKQLAKRGAPIAVPSIWWIARKS